MLRSDEKRPSQATLRIALRDQQSCLAKTQLTPSGEVQYEAKIGQHEKWIVIEKLIDERSEKILIAAAENPAGDGIDRSPQTRIGFIKTTRAIAASLERRGLFDRQPRGEHAAPCESRYLCARR